MDESGNHLVFIDGVYSGKDSHLSSDVRVLANDGTLEIVVAANTRLDLLAWYEDPSLNQSFKRRILLQRNAVLECASFVLGGVSVREETHVRFDGEGASASLKGLGVLRGDSRLIQQVTAEHAAGHCTSEQFFKNVLADSARSEFNSLVHVHPGAQQSHSQQLSKNMLLSERAQAHARPQLRILNDDVSCAHGATVGQIEKEEIFYLRSRGLSEEAARLLLINGFAQEIVDRVTDARSRERIGQRVHRALEEMVHANHSHAHV